MALRATHDGRVGQRLALARSIRGLDLDRAAADLRIDRRYLEALEANAGLRAFPGPMYARIFLREYARYLGLSPKPLLRAYAVTHPDLDRQLFEAAHSFSAAPKRWTKPLLWVLSVAGLGAVVVLSVRSDGDVAVPVRDLGPAPATAVPTVAPAEVPVVTESATDVPVELPVPVHVRLEVVSAPSWIRVSQGETVLVEGTESPGFVTNVLVRDDVDLAFGNAGAVRVTLDGRELPLLGVEGEVYAGRLVIHGGRAHLERVP